MFDVWNDYQIILKPINPSERDSTILESTDLWKFLSKHQTFPASCLQTVFWHPWNCCPRPPPPLNKEKPRDPQFKQKFPCICVFCGKKNTLVLSNSPLKQKPRLSRHLWPLTLLAGQDLCRLITLVEKNKRMATKWVTRVRPKKKHRRSRIVGWKVGGWFLWGFLARRVLGFFQVFRPGLFFLKQKLVLEMKFVELSVFGFLTDILESKNFSSLETLLLGFVGRHWAKMGVMSELYLQF